MDQQTQPHVRTEQLIGTEDFIIDLFCRVDAAMAEVRRHPQAALWPGETVTPAILFTLAGRRQRPFYRWLKRDWLAWFPRLPDRTRLFRLFAVHRDWSDRFLASPTVFGIADSFGIELIQTRRLGRSDRQIATRGFCAGGWIAGVKLGLVVNRTGRVCAWGVQTANVYDADAFDPLIHAYDQQMIVLADSNVHKGESRRPDPQDRDPPNLKVCPRDHGNQRRLIETVLSMLTGVCGLKRLSERAWPYLKAHLAFVVAAFNLLTCWSGKPTLAIAQFSL